MPPEPRRPMMLPKEHGAYAQVGCALAAALLVAGARPGPVLLAVAVVAAFLLHEPLLIVLGKRGARARAEQGAHAARWLLVQALVMTGAGTLAVLAMGRSAPWLLVPAVPAAGVFLAAARGMEKEWPAQTAVALAASLSVVPIAAAAQIPATVFGMMAAALALNFVLGSLAVRGIVLRARGGGDERASLATRKAVLALGVGAALALWAINAAGFRKPLASHMAFVFAIGIPMGVAAIAPPPGALRRVGWVLVSATVSVTALLVVAYR